MSKQKKVFRGSQKHMLDWLDQPNFLEEFRDCCLSDVDAEINFGNAQWMPKGNDSPAEATTAKLMKSKDGKISAAWKEIYKWWLGDKTPFGRKTPNWDFAADCNIGGKKGMILVEAKAHVGEFGQQNKCGAKEGSMKEITRADKEAGGKWPNGILAQKVELKVDDHYQLSNRLAHTWKLASLRVPVVLVYLGFTGDTAFQKQGSGDIFTDNDHWDAQFKKYASGVNADEVFGKRWDFEKAPIWLVSASREVLEGSPPKP